MHQVLEITVSHLQNFTNCPARWSTGEVGSLKHTWWLQAILLRSQSNHRAKITQKKPWGSWRGYSTNSLSNNPHNSYTKTGTLFQPREDWQKPWDSHLGIHNFWKRRVSQNLCEVQSVLHLITGKSIKVTVRLKSMSIAPVYYKLQLPTEEYACCISHCYIQICYLGIVYGSTTFDLKCLALFYSEIPTATVLSLYS